MYRAFRVPSDVCAYFEKKNGKFLRVGFRTVKPTWTRWGRGWNGLLFFPDKASSLPVACGVTQISNSYAVNMRAFSY